MPVLASRVSKPCEPEGEFNLAAKVVIVLDDEDRLATLSHASLRSVGTSLPHRAWLAPAARPAIHDGQKCPVKSGRTDCNRLRGICHVMRGLRLSGRLQCVSNRDDLAVRPAPHAELVPDVTP